MRVLVVEDYMPLRLAIVKGLTEAGYAVDACANGKDGEWHIQSNDYDVVVLDLMLPEVDGLTVLRNMRARGDETHVLILTAKDAAVDRVEGLNLGADDYLTKPFVFDELLARVRALIRRRYGEKSPQIVVSDLTLDTMTKEVRRGEERIELTAKEYALLEFLVMRKGQVVSRSDIWEHVYDLHSGSTSNVVDVYISYLRKKIDYPGVDKLIHTRRGQGYVLTETS